MLSITFITACHSGRLFTTTSICGAQVSLVTLDIGANDLLGDINPATCQVSNTFDTDLQTLDNNLTKTILPQLHAALKGKHGQITGSLMLLNYYDPFQNVCRNSVQNIQELNRHLARDVEGFGSLVNIFEAFGGAAVPNPNICNDTWMCSSSPGPDVHPTTAGYLVMASALERSCGLGPFREQVDQDSTRKPDR